VIGVRRSPDPPRPPDAGGPTTEAPLVVLHVEDTPSHADLVEIALREADRGRGAYRLLRATRLADALERLGAGDVDVVLLDLSLPDSQGLATYSAVHARAPDLPVVVASALDDEELALAAVRDGAQDYIVKGPGMADLVVRALRYAVERRRAQQALLGEQAARAEAEAEVRRIRLAAKQRRTRQSRELRALDRLSQPRGATATARAYGVEPLRRAVPGRFDELVRRYEGLLDAALEERTYKVDPGSPDVLRALADDLGFLRAGPRDILDLHTTALKNKLAGAVPRRAQAYVEEARLMVLELMGHLVRYYRG
jgi:DNA-binding response OmpR family regulator